MISAPAFTGIHHINFSVTDLERSGRWYQDVLGLELGWEMPDVEGRGRKIVLLVPGSSLRLVLSQHQANDGQPASEFRTGMDHLALTVADRAALEAWIGRFAEAGVTHSEIKEGATGYLIVFRDPDNIQLEMYTISK
jgi:catechol 2,3-dioxygenase-like lactoylglutathione lyase family enzyme